jgi:hypothetical protein
VDNLNLLISVNLAKPIEWGFKIKAKKKTSCDSDFIIIHKLKVSSLFLAITSVCLLLAGTSLSLSLAAPSFKLNRNKLHASHSKCT